MFKTFSSLEHIPINNAKPVIKKQLALWMKKTEI